VKELIAETMGVSHFSTKPESAVTVGIATAIPNNACAINSRFLEKTLPIRK
jgi:hypothetical protein